MKRLIPFVFFLLMSRFGYSQAGYPKLIVYNNDTLVAMTVKQATYVNITQIQGERYRELADSLSSHKKKLQVLVVSQDSVIASLYKEGAIKDTLLTNKDIIISELRREVRKRDGRIKWLKFQNYILYATTGGLGVAVVVLATKDKWLKK